MEDARRASRVVTSGLAGDDPGRDRDVEIQVPPVAINLSIDFIKSSKCLIVIGDAFLVVAHFQVAELLARVAKVQWWGA